MQRFIIRIKIRNFAGQKNLWDEQVIFINMIRDISITIMNVIYTEYCIKKALTCSRSVFSPEHGRTFPKVFRHAHCTINHCSRRPDTNFPCSMSSIKKIYYNGSYIVIDIFRAFFPSNTVNLRTKLPLSLKIISNQNLRLTVLKENCAMLIFTANKLI